ncbi:pentatricopeptide repeat-containing protein At5g66520 [Ricinus communis]|uniref:pentatricopeptide repeat-containing protein At5g66520 n=1 Tax=Ricinus communis TaxID=3988 RepID=UPI000772C2AF|nr:pentatricopeptide repeat-containing protein At5g66520 [Ricinus communis]XP_015580928.1 pentatricopeptide repeat-containing protein At5g66520 [Ricinus communis]|eukprot:XP_015580927.1 pentatricopeptide repeat-containing protein At5g66520 [Ricinus communis]
MIELRNIMWRMIQHCKNINQLKQIHALILTSPNLDQKDHYFLISRLLFFAALSDSGSLAYAADIFHYIKKPNLPFYNIMIRAYASKSNVDYDDARLCQALILYKQMLCNDISPDCLTFPFLLKECTRNVAIYGGRGIHGHAIKLGLYSDLFVQNSLISFYSACEFVSNSRKLFDEMSNRDVVSWNSMIIGYLRSGDLDQSLNLFRKMKINRNVITWNSIITGFVQGGRPKEALEFFHEMQCLRDDDGINNKVRPDKITIASVLSACAHLGAIDHGKWVHSYLRRSGLECDMVIGTALVDMYGKCGCLQRAYEVFREMSEKDTLAWTAMISVFALNGFGKEAFDMFNEMEAGGVKPNLVTFVGLLSACAHSGLVETGRWCFNAMKSVYSIDPQVHHYACMVDILGRAGLFEEAEQLIRNMPMEPDVFVWGALLGGCQMHGNVQLGERVAQHLIDLDPLNHAFYVNLCDIYAKTGRYTDVKRIRAAMNEQGIKKEVPGCSMIEVKGIVHEFSVIGSPNIVMEELISVLNALSNEMKINNNLH